MLKMWQLLSLNSPITSNRDGSSDNPLLSTSRRITCLVFLFSFTLLLTIASMYEHFTNICIGFLFIVMMFFLVYSILIKSNISGDMDPSSTNTTDYVWTIQPMHQPVNNREQVLRSPPSYESVVHDSKYISHNIHPPPYSEVVMNQDNAKLTSIVNNKHELNHSATKNQPTVIDILTLPEERN